MDDLSVIDFRLSSLICYSKLLSFTLCDETEKSILKCYETWIEIFEKETITNYILDIIVEIYI